MAETARSRSFYVVWTVGILAVVSAGLAVVASGPDFELKLVREVPSEENAQTLGQAIEVVRNWPKWFNSLEAAQVLDASGQPYLNAEQKIQKGSVVKLNFDPLHGPFKKFSVIVAIKEFIPNQKVEIQVLSDSHRKLNHLFDNVLWSVEIFPREHGSIVRGVGLAHTAMWRSRLFGKLFNKILINQVYFPDIIHLAMLGKPEPTNPFSDAQN